MTPGVSILRPFSYAHDVKGRPRRSFNSRLTLEILHDVKEPVVHIRLFRELDLDLVKVAESVLFEKDISTGVPREQLLTTLFCGCISH